MCGLAGLWMPRGSAHVRDLHQSAAAMAAALQHRGPDDAGVWVDPEAGLALAHQRLAIVDLSPAGHQPMASASGRYQLVFNGEIYNHHALREQLQRNGALAKPWRGHSDTETLLVAIEAWGLESTLQRCAGMFALALWDSQERRLHLARDRFGEKPLYWGWLEQSGKQVLVFASELAALRTCPGASTPALNPKALAAFFRTGCIPAPLSIYVGVQQLLPGHCVAFSSPHQHPNPQPWWALVHQAMQAFARSPLRQRYQRPPSSISLKRPSG